MKASDSCCVAKLTPGVLLAVHIVDGGLDMRINQGINELDIKYKSGLSGKVL
jgi:hypothetical protein